MAEYVEECPYCVRIERALAQLNNELVSLPGICVQDREGRTIGPSTWRIECRHCGSVGTKLTKAGRQLVDGLLPYLVGAVKDELRKEDVTHETPTL